MLNSAYVDKDKLLAISTPAMANTVSFQDKKIPFAYTAEHVGILRSETSNLPNIMNRIKANQNA